jgi:CMP-N-acetylneuraminic acid synthetase
MSKRIAMIPLLLGSTRIKDKNLLLVNGQPLVHYVVKASKEANILVQKIISDYFGLDIVIPEYNEEAAVGAALIAKKYNCSE